MKAIDKIACGIAGTGVLVFAWAMFYSISHRSVPNTRVSEVPHGADAAPPLTNPNSLTSPSNTAPSVTVAATAQPTTPAERQLRTSIANNTRLLGPEHQDTLSSRIELAEALGEQGKHAEAENELRGVLGIQERVVGTEHVNTFRTRGDLAMELADQGKHAEAEKVNRKILSIQERVFGYENPFVFVTCEDLATSLEAQGRMREAYEYIKRAETGLVKLLGPEKPPSLKIKAVRERIEAKLK